MTKSQALDKLDFDHWLELAKSDPVSFEELRSQTINEAIARFAKSRQSHLRRIQWRIDKVRERSGTPMAACIAISNMMWDSFHHLNNTYQYLAQQTQGGRPRKEVTPLPSAKVLTFRPRAH
jgi:hypothetical protein